MATSLSEKKLPLTKLPTTKLRGDGTYDDLFRLFNSIRQLVGDVDEVLEQYLQDAPSDGTLYGRKDGAWAATIQSLVAGTNVTIDDTDPLNPIINASGGGGGGGGGGNIVITSNTLGTSAGHLNYTTFCNFPAAVIMNAPAAWKFTLNLYSNNLINIVIGGIKVIRTLPGSLAVIDRTDVTVGGSTTPTITVPAVNTLIRVVTDSIALPIDLDHDYWILVFFSGAPSSGVGIYTLASTSYVNCVFQAGNQLMAASMPATATSKLLVSNIRGV